jgi:hypothetical protein
MISGSMRKILKTTSIMVPTTKIEGTVVGELPIRKDLRLLTEEGYSVNFYLRDSFGSIVILNPMLDALPIAYNLGNPG